MNEHVYYQDQTSPFPGGFGANAKPAWFDPSSAGRSSSCNRILHRFSRLALRGNQGLAGADGPEDEGGSHCCPDSQVCQINLMVVSLSLVRIDMIDSSTLSYYGSGSGSVSVGGFTWSGHFTWEGLPAKVETIIFSSSNNLLLRWQPRESQQIQQRLPQWPEGSLPLTETSFGRLVSHQCDISLSLTSQLGGRLRRGDGRLGR